MRLTALALVLCACLGGCGHVGPLEPPEGWEPTQSAGHTAPGG